MNYQNSFPGYPDYNGNCGLGEAHRNNFTNNISPWWGPYSHSVPGYGQQQRFGATNYNRWSVSPNFGTNFPIHQNNAFPQVLAGTPLHPPLPLSKPKPPPPQPSPEPKIRPTILSFGPIQPYQRYANTPKAYSNVTPSNPEGFPILFEDKKKAVQLNNSLTSNFSLQTRKSTPLTKPGGSDTDVIKSNSNSKSKDIQTSLAITIMRSRMHDLEVNAASYSNDPSFRDLLIEKIKKVAACFRNCFLDKEEFVSQILQKTKSNNPQQSLAFLWAFVIALNPNYGESNAIKTKKRFNEFTEKFMETFYDLATRKTPSFLLELQDRVEELVVLRKRMGKCLNGGEFAKIDVMLNKIAALNWCNRMGHPNKHKSLEDFYPSSSKVKQSNRVDLGIGEKGNKIKSNTVTDLDKQKTPEVKNPRWESNWVTGIPLDVSPEWWKNGMESVLTLELNADKQAAVSVDKPAVPITTENPVSTMKAKKRKINNKIPLPDGWSFFTNEPDQLYKTTKSAKTAKLKKKEHHHEIIDLCEKPVSSTTKTKKRKINNEIPLPDGWPFFTNEPDQLRKTTKSDKTAKLKKKEHHHEIIDLCEKPVSSTTKTKKRKINNEIPLPDGWPFFTNEPDQLRKTTKSDKTAKLKQKEHRYEIIDLCEKPVNTIETKKHKTSNKIPEPDEKCRPFSNNASDNLNKIEKTTKLKLKEDEVIATYETENILPATTTTTFSSTSNKQDDDNSENVLNPITTFCRTSTSGEVSIEEILNAATTFSGSKSDNKCINCNEIIVTAKRYKNTSSFSSNTSDKHCSSCTKVCKNVKVSKTVTTSLGCGSRSDEILNATPTASSSTKDKYCSNCKQIFKTAKRSRNTTTSLSIESSVETRNIATSDKHCGSCTEILKTAKRSRNVATPYCSASGKVYSSMDEILNTAWLSSCTSGEVYNTIDEILHAANHFSSTNSEEYNGSSIEILAERSKNTAASLSDKSEPNSPSKVSHSSCTLSFHGLPILCESNPEEAERESKDPEENRVIVVHDKMSLEKFVDNILAKTVKYWGIVKQSDGQFAMQFVHSKKVIVFKAKI